MCSKLVRIKKKGKYNSLLQKTLTIPSTDRAGTYMSVESGEETWMNLYIQYLKTKNIIGPRENGWVRKTTRYALIGGELYKRCINQLLLRCITKKRS